MKIKVKNFSSVVIGDYPTHENLSSQITPILENYSGGIGHTNLKCIHTEWNWGSDIFEIQNFKTFIMNETFKNFDTKLVGSSQTTLECSNFWANIYRKGEYSESHHHIPYNISFVYFLKCRWSDSPFIFTDCEKRIRPKEGRYVIFPSHLKHYVPKQRNNSKRITLSGNIKIHTK
jgi:hypothetical protein